MQQNTKKDKEQQKQILALKRKIKYSSIKKEEFKEIEDTKRKHRKEIKQISDHNDQLQEKLSTFLEILKNVLGDPKSIKLDRLTMKDYTDYIRIYEYMTKKNKKVITAHSLHRIVLFGHGSREIELCLFNLSKMGLVSLAVGTKYLEMSLSGKTVFQKQKESVNNG